MLLSCALYSQFAAIPAAFAADVSKKNAGFFSSELRRRQLGLNCNNPKEREGGLIQPRQWNQVIAKLEIKDSRRPIRRRLEEI